MDTICVWMGWLFFICVFGFVGQQPNVFESILLMLLQTITDRLFDMIFQIETCSFWQWMRQTELIELLNERNELNKTYCHKAQDVVFL
jgi:hypothetical protein